ncbi:MAG: hypothetical protein KAI08_03005 [Bacteroidales bacterium]|nr:hypothetical protein [Bacteroidales bacterium]
MRLKRILYLIYYTRGLDRAKYRLFLNHAAKTTGRSKPSLVFDMLVSVFRHNISLLDYFYFRFYKLERSERLKWAGTGYLYEYQLKMNPRQTRMVLEDKIQFLERYKPFISRKHADIQTVKEDREILNDLLGNDSGRLVLKGSHGQVGAEVEVVSCSDFTAPDLLAYMQEKNFDLLEEYVIQHPTIMALSSTGLNTLRVFTQIQEGEIHFLGARFRISVNSPVDNMGAGNLAAPVNLDTGVLSGPGVYSDITREDEAVHPVSGQSITGFTVPFWEEVLDLSTRAALHTRENRSVGWDIAITENGPELIEGNHNWCKLLWQLPVKEGLKKELEKFH